MIDNGATDFRLPIRQTFLNGHTDIVNLLILKNRRIPLDLSSLLTEEQIYLFYKSGVIPSALSERVFVRLQAVDNISSVILSKIMIHELKDLVLSY